MDQYESLVVNYKGWTLTEIRDLSPRERFDWLQRALRRIG